MTRSWWGRPGGVSGESPGAAPARRPRSDQSLRRIPGSAPAVCAPWDGRAVAPNGRHWEPSVASIRSAVKFISRYSERGEKVYVHCKAGHGRSAAVVFCWLASQKPDMEPEAITRSMLSRRKVRKTLHVQPTVRSFLRELAAKRDASSSSGS